MNVLSIAGFTNLGYAWHARSFAPIAGDTQDKTVLVTGATAGLGLEIAKALGVMGARVILVGRDERKLKMASDEIGANSVPIVADLSLLGEVRELARRILEDEPDLSLLVNNVGVLSRDHVFTDEGLELTFATNVAGHFVLTNTLAPLLVRNAPSRVVNMTSGGMYAVRVEPLDLMFERGEYSGTGAYARSKRAQVILNEMWAERLEQWGVCVSATHPGWAKTPGVANSLPAFNRVMRPLLRNPKQGADTAIWLAADTSTGIPSGKLWFDRRIVPTHLTLRTRESGRDRDDLWERLTGLTGSELVVDSAQG